MPRRRRRTALAVISTALALVLVALLLCWWFMIRMPGTSHRGALAPLSAAQERLARELRADVEHLASRIGPRHAMELESLRRAADWIEERLGASGLPVERRSFDAGGTRFVNLEAELRGRDRPDEIVVVGAHYDSVPVSPGADDNGSGVAALLALAGRLGPEPLSRTVRFVAFANEEQPFFQSRGMGSLVYARGARRSDEEVVAMLSLESLGYYSLAEGSQSYPFPLSALYPSRGDFIGFVGNLGSRDLVRRAIGTFREHARFPSEGAALPGWVPGVGWSDQWAFWKVGYPAIMITDTAPFRNPYYHTPGDTPETLDYDRLARVVTGLEHVIRDLSRSNRY